MIRRGGRPGADPGADVRPAGATALRDRIEARIGRRRPGGRPPSPSCAPSRRTRSACCAAPPPSGASRAPAAHRPRAGPRDPRAARRARRGRRAGRRRCARRCAPGRSPPSCATCCCARPSAASARDAGPAGPAHGRPDWAAAARFLEDTCRCSPCATPRPGAASPTTTPSWSGRPPRCWPTTRRCSRPSGAGCRYVYVDELADTDPAQIDLLDLIAGGGAHVVGVRRPGLLDVRVPRRRPDRGRATSRPVPRPPRARAPQVTLRTALPLGAGLLDRDPPGGGPAARPRPAPRVLRAALTATRPAARCEVVTFRSATSEAAYLAHRLREAHLHRRRARGRGWRSWSARPHRQLRAAAAGAAPRPGVPTVTGAEDLPLHRSRRSRRCCCCCAARWSRPARRGGRGRAAALAARRRRPAGRAAAAPGPAGARARRRRPAPSGELLVEALRDPAELAMVERRWAAPARTVAGLLRDGPGGGRRPGATAEDVLWAVWRASGLADGGRRASARRRPPRAPPPTGTSTRCVVLFDAAARFTDRLPGAGIEVVPGPLLEPAAARRLARPDAPTGARRSGSSPRTPPRAWSGTWSPSPACRRASGPTCGCAAACSARSGWSTCSAGRAPAATGIGRGQVAALLDEERRLFYVAVTRARRSLLVTAVDPARTGGDGEEQPSRFLARAGRRRIPTADDRTWPARRELDPTGVLPGRPPRR